VFLARKTVNVVVAEQTLKPEVLAHFPTELNLPARKGIVDLSIRVIVGIADRRANVPVALVSFCRQ